MKGNCGYITDYDQQILNRLTKYAYSVTSEKKYHMHSIQCFHLLFADALQKFTMLYVSGFCCLNILISIFLCFAETRITNCSDETNLRKSDFSKGSGI